MSVKVYIAAPLSRVRGALSFKAELLQAGAAVVSTWHDEEPTIAGERALRLTAWTKLAARCRAEVLSADALLLLWDPRHRSGHVVELGIAFGAGKPVVVIRKDDGERDCIFLAGEGVICLTAGEVLTFLRDR